MMVTDEMIEKYRKGSKPTQDISQAEVDEIKSLLFKTVDQTEIDYNNGVFQNYQEYPTSTGFTLKNIAGAIQFNNFHEGVHIGIMVSIKKVV